jgi:hypothetical protein
MGNTQAKLSAAPEQTKRDAKCNTLKRQASPPLLHTFSKRRAIVSKAEDNDHAHESLLEVPQTNMPYGPLRDCLDEDEKFLEQPHIFDLVAVVAKRHKMDDELLHRSYRGQDVLTSLESVTGQRHISMSKVKTFRPVTAIVNSVPIGTGEQHKHKMFVLGREQEEGAQWLNVSYHLDTQMPHVILRISAPSMRDSNGRYEPLYVYIFATNLAEAPYKPIRIRTGKDVNISQKRTKRLRHIRPRLLNKAKEGLLTEMTLQFCRLDKGRTDVEGRSSRPIIVGKVSRTDLDRMAAEVIGGKADQPAHEQLLGLIHGDKIREGLDLYSEYDGDNLGYESTREAHFCKLFRLTMILCNELGNFWAYRLQFPDISWTDESFPFDKLQPPRWTVKKWFARAVSDGQAAVAALPAQWEAINRPKVLPGTEEESFLRGLDAVEEDPASMRAFVRKLLW